mmetsp:Transcript_19438/g.45094  ORF Transcript_19438/g.45094 Transcript_19438/m.45094 type:complete len:128 (-) Transcript_19438:418-801(-)
MSNVVVTVMCQMQECMPKSAYSYWPPHIKLDNPSHRPYKRGWLSVRQTVIYCMLKVNFGGHLDHCLELEMTKHTELYDVGFIYIYTPWADSMEELQALIPDPQFNNKNSCACIPGRTIRAVGDCRLV